MEVESTHLAVGVEGLGLSGVGSRDACGNPRELIGYSGPESLSKTF